MHLYTPLFCCSKCIKNAFGSGLNVIKLKTISSCVAIICMTILFGCLDTFKYVINLQRNGLCSLKTGI